MNPIEASMNSNRRLFLKSAGLSLGAISAAALGSATSSPANAATTSGTQPLKATAKRVIYLFQSGAPSQFETFDYKPGLKAIAKSELPDSVRGSQRLTGMTSGQSSFPVAPSIFNFAQG
ncbi:MAG: DUF1501 domain-containing protein, partial [Aureliella sp.]